MLELFAAALLAATGGGPASPPADEAAASVAKSLDDDLLQRYAAFLEDSLNERPGVAHLGRPPGTPPIGRVELLAKHRLTEAQVHGLEELTDGYYTARARASAALSLGGATQGSASKDLQGSTRKLETIIDRYLGLLRKGLAKRYGARVPDLLDARWDSFWYYFMNRPAQPFRIRPTEAGLQVARSLTDELLSRYAALELELEPEEQNVARELVVRVAKDEDPSKIGDELRRRLQGPIDAALRRHGLTLEQVHGLQDLTHAYYGEMQRHRQPEQLAVVELSFTEAYGEPTLALLKKHWPEFQPYYEAMSRDAKVNVDATRAAIRGTPGKP